MIKKPAAKRATKRRSTVYGATGFGHVKNESLASFGEREMGVYAEEVNLGRAVPDLIDGLKPVQRRIMWAASHLGRDFVKTARLVGDVIGKYHPHGDQSVSGAITLMVQGNVPVIAGRGNWGSLIDPAAAMRYTNCTLSDYGQTFFDANYIHKEVTAFVPNYDDTTVEPVSLPSMLPNVLMTGAEGIGVGTTTKLPSFTPESLVTILKRILKGDKLQVLDFARTLKLTYRYGGKLVNSKENKAQWLQLFKEDNARLTLESKLVIDRDQKSIEIMDWPQGLNPLKFIMKVRTFPEVDQAVNHKGATGFRIEMRRDHNYAQFDKLVDKVQKATRIGRSFKVNVTHRQSSIDDGVVSFDTKYLSLSVPHLLMAWLRERLSLEKRSLTFRIKKQEEAIAYSELLIFAAQNADAIIKVIRQSKVPLQDLMRKFKLSELQANQILDLKLRNLSRLDQDAIEAKLREQRAHLKQLAAWLKKPRVKVSDDLDLALAAIVADRKFEQLKGRKLSVS